MFLSIWRLLLILKENAEKMLQNYVQNSVDWHLDAWNGWVLAHLTIESFYETYDG